MSNSNRVIKDTLKVVLVIFESTCKTSKQNIWQWCQIWLGHTAVTNRQLWRRYDQNLTLSSMETLQRIFPAFRRLLMRHNQTNNTGVMVSESCRRLLKILVWTELRFLRNLNFWSQSNAISGNLPYQHCRWLSQLPDASLHNLLG
jgi:hypothetical protein